MRMFITFLLVVAAVVASNERVSATKVSDSATIAKLTPESMDYPRAANGGARFLRKQETDEIDDDLDAEERANLKDVTKYVKKIFSEKERTKSLLQKSNSDLLKKKVSPGALKKAVDSLERRGTDKSKIAQFRAAVDDYDSYWYKYANLDPVRD